MTIMRIIAAGLLAATLLAAPLSAQDRWSVELSGGAAFPTGDLGMAELSTGLGFEGTLAYRFMPHLAVYGGWDWFHFTTDEASEAAELDVEETGYVFGLRFEHPLGSMESPLLRVRVGGTYGHIEIEDDEGEIVEDTGHGLGFEGGLGLVLRVGDAWTITPGARFRSLSRDVSSSGFPLPPGGESGATEVDLRYVAAEIGFARRF